MSPTPKNKWYEITFACCNDGNSQHAPVEVRVVTETERFLACDVIIRREQLDDWRYKVTYDDYPRLINKDFVLMLEPIEPEEPGLHDGTDEG